jgi:hypothetical protein
MAQGSPLPVTLGLVDLREVMVWMALSHPGFARLMPERHV